MMLQINYTNQFLNLEVMKSLTKEKRYDLIDAFNSTPRYIDDLLNIDTIHFEHMVHRTYPAELQLNKWLYHNQGSTCVSFSIIIGP